MKRTTYEKVTDLDLNGVAKAMIDGEVFWDKNGTGCVRWSGMDFIDCHGEPVKLYDTDYHYRIVTEVTWQDEVKRLLGYTEMSDGYIEVNDVFSHQRFLELCRAVMIATGDIK